MIISQSRRFVFIHVHKAGGTSMEVALEPHLAWNDLILGSTPFGQQINAHYARRFRLSKHSSFADIARVCGEAALHGFFVFALVRHPEDRLCSLYNFVARTIESWSARHGPDLPEIRRRLGELAPAHPPLRWAASRAFIGSDDLGGFLRSPHLAQDPAFRTQLSRLIDQAGQRRAETYRLEDIGTALPAIAERLGVPLSLPHLNRTERKLARRADLTAGDRALIRDRFAEDFAAFGYE